MKVSGIYIYPVKGCRGLSLSKAEAGKYGLLGDRNFLIVDAQGKFMTQRQVARMALIETALTSNTLSLFSNGYGSFDYPLNSAAFGTPRAVTIWKSECLADDCGDNAAMWLSRFLGVECRLVRIGTSYIRPVKPEKAKPGDEVSFADGYPLLIVTEESLADLNHRLDDAVPMNRFRPNIVVTGAGAYAEDSWSKVRIGQVIFRATGPCGRCIVTTTDQFTSERGKEPLRTLAMYRKDERNEVNFGQNFVNESKTGVVAIGDTVEITE